MSAKKASRKKSATKQPLASIDLQVTPQDSRINFRTILGKIKRLNIFSIDSPHQSFRRTKRRDYARPLNLPGYIAFTVLVWQTLWRNKSTFGLLVIIYGLSSGFLVGMASQSTYVQLAEVLRSSSGDIFEGNLGKVGEAGSLLLTGLSGGLNPSITELQQFLAGMLVLIAWLTTVWLLRAFVAGNKPRLRDGLYNAGAPLIPTLLIGLLLLIQLIPAAIAAIGFAAILPTGLASQGVEAMLFWVVAMLLLLLSLYWITATLMAMIVVTLPGMYPMQAVRAASDLVLGRRFRLLLRIAWLVFITIFSFALTMIPIILFDAWLKGLLPSSQAVPIVPVSLLIASAASTVWSAAYVYLLYRKVVDDDSTAR